jgi:hypothetical protein
MELKICCNVSFYNLQGHKAILEKARQVHGAKKYVRNDGILYRILHCIYTSVYFNSYITDYLSWNMHHIPLDS